MRNNVTWILFLVLPCVSVTPLPVQNLRVDDDSTSQLYHHNSHRRSPEQGNSSEEQVISVRITSSVAVGRGKARTDRLLDDRHETGQSEPQLGNSATELDLSTVTDKIVRENNEEASIIPTALTGANMEFIKQLQSKKEARGLHNYEKVHTLPLVRNEYSVNETDDTVAESSESLRSVFEIENMQKEGDDINENIPMARSLSQSPSPKSYIQGLNRKSPSERGNPRLTTVSFNIVHDTPKAASNDESSDTYQDPRQAFTSPPMFFYNPPKIYNEPSKIYSQPAKVYGEPAKFYSEPAKIYSEPAKIYGEPAKIYSEPAKIYSEPAKFYSQPASLHLSPDVGSHIPWNRDSQSPAISSTTVTTTEGTTIARYAQSSIVSSTQRSVEYQPEKNYEVDEKVSVLTDGRSHGVQESSTESCKQENCKVGYVVEGRQYRKYRVEERTADGFIVGEYGVVRNEDGALRGVRYTADSDASPRLIYDALMKFLQLK